MQSHLNGRTMEMFQSGELTDFVIEVQLNDGQEKKEFKVHKFVLALHSEVFSAMLRHKSTKEFRESRLRIKDSTATAVNQMLIYMYNGGKPEDFDIDKDAAHLMKIANKYQIEPLMELIEDELVDSLSLHNVFETLALADLYQIGRLKYYCRRTMLRDLPAVKTSAKWIELKKKSPDLAFSILEKFADELHYIKEYSSNSSPSSPQMPPAPPAFPYPPSP